MNFRSQRVIDTPSYFSRIRNVGMLTATTDLPMGCSWRPANISKNMHPYAPLLVDPGQYRLELLPETAGVPLTNLSVYLTLRSKYLI